MGWQPGDGSVYAQYLPQVPTTGPEVDVSGGKQPDGVGYAGPPWGYAWVYQQVRWPIQGAHVRV